MDKLDDKTLRKLQLTELEVLNEMVRICDKHQLTYYLSGGTLVGAVACKGFVPWDDDIDVSMPVDDYRKFVKIANRELPDNMFMETADNDDTHIEAYGKIKILNSTFIQEGYIPYGKNNGIWIDVFPIVYADSQEESRKKRFMLKLSYCCNCKEYAKKNPELFKNTYGSFLSFLLKIFLKTPKSFRKWIHRRLTDSVFSKKEGAYYFGAFPWGDRIVPSDAIKGEKTMIEFEGCKYTTFPKPEIYLTSIYGDYMTPPPEEKRYAHKPQVIDFEHSYTELKNKED